MCRHRPAHRHTGKVKQHAPGMRTKPYRFGDAVIHTQRLNAGWTTSDLRKASHVDMDLPFHNMDTSQRKTSKFGFGNPLARGGGGGGCGGGCGSGSQRKNSLGTIDETATAAADGDETSTTRARRDSKTETAVAVANYMQVHWTCHP